ncbi:MAG: LegC family aminotransferase [Rubripirellula sp.]|nr:LegC family aminotransferase [Rubripirellula sp.]
MTTKNYFEPALTPSDPSDTDRWIPGLIRTLREVVGTGEFVPLHQPEIGDVERGYVLDCIDSGWVSSVGRYVDQLEQMLVDYTGAAHAVAVVNGTAALHISLLLAGVQADDEVICPALSFVATANAISYCGAIPHFAEVESTTLGLDAEKLAAYLQDISVSDGNERRNRITGRRIAAVVPMHTFGHPVDLDALVDVCCRFDLPMVEDAAESLGSYYRSQHTGTFGQSAAISFNGNKIMTTGGGGAILTNDPVLAARAKHLTTTAKQPHAWAYHHDCVGYNYRMPNLNAALGCGQLGRLDEMRSRKRNLAESYRQALSSVPQVRWINEPPNCSSNFWLGAIVVDGGLEARDAVLAAANQAGIMSRPIWDLLSGLPMYRQCPGMDLATSCRLLEQIVCLPSSAALGTQSKMASPGAAGVG